jgi:hypothetical protein
MRLRKPTKEEKTPLLAGHLNRQYGATDIAEERQECADAVEDADIAIFDYNEGYKTMMVLWEREECYSETFTLKRYRLAGEETIPRLHVPKPRRPIARSGHHPVSIRAEPGTTDGRSVTHKTARRKLPAFLSQDAARECNRSQISVLQAQGSR